MKLSYCLLQGMTEAKVCSLKELGLWPKAEAEGMKFCKFCPQNSFSSPNSEVDLLTIC